MTYRRFETKIIFLVLLLFSALCAGAFLLVRGWFVYEWLVLPLAVYSVFRLYKTQSRTSEEVARFIEAINYRDFSQHYNELSGPPELLLLRKGFNEINATFKAISKEKETQYHYLQNILELVDTGILSYDIETGDIVWMNESLKQLLKVPYLKNIHSLSRRNPALTERILAIQPGERNISVIHSDKIDYKILISATGFNTGDKKFKLVAFQNANEALDETEADAWQKLLRVMTHEIMNSVAPISSLAETLEQRLDEVIRNSGSDESAIEDMRLAIDTIKKRSVGLLKFADTYRNLSKIKNPERKEVFVRDLFENLYRLMQPTITQKNIELEIVLQPSDLKIFVDVSLVEQVLINLLLNAIDAVKDKEEPRIELSGMIAENDRPLLIITDNGIGIEEDILDKIFIPFFTTRKNGSGIGLSLCRQIMLLHKGNIQAQSRPGSGTSFVLQF